MQILRQNQNRLNIECQTSTLDLSLELEPRDALVSDEVIVTAKSESRVIKEKGYAMNIVDMKKASLSSLISSDLLDRTAGIKLRQSGVFGSEIQYNINGLSGNSIRVFYGLIRRDIAQWLTLFLT